MKYILTKSGEVVECAGGRLTGNRRLPTEFEEQLFIELEESNRIISLDNRQIEELGDKVWALSSALESIASGITEDMLGKTSLSREEMQDIARQALSLAANVPANS